MNAILAISILVTAGLLGGAAARRLRLPSVTGNIVAGILIGPYLGNLLTHEIVYQTLKPISQIALSLIAVSIASHLKISRLRGRTLSLFIITLAQAASAMIAVYYFSGFWLASPVTRLLLATIAASTAPAATLAVVRETEADGPLVKSLLAVVALDNVLAIVIFVLVSAGLTAGLGGEVGFLAQAGRAAMVFCQAFLLGGAGGGLLVFLTRRFHSRAHLVSLLLMVVSCTTGLALELGISPLLPNMVLGFIITNFATGGSRLLGSVDDLEPFLYVCFFTLAGTHLNIALLPALGTAGAAYIAARFGGKIIGATLGGLLTRAPKTITRHLGLCLLPQAGIAIGLVVAVQENPLFNPYEAPITVIILAAIVISELFGPILVKAILTRTGETGRSGNLLFGIVPRNGITFDCRARDKWRLLEELVDFSARVYGAGPEEKARLLQSVIERERSLSTGLGKGVAIPHGTVPRGRQIMGVMAIIPEGVDFDSLDGEKARVVILMVIPERRFEDHLRTLAAVSKVFSRPQMVDRLAAAADPHEAYHLIYSEESGDTDFLPPAGMPEEPPDPEQN